MLPDWMDISNLTKFEKAAIGATSEVDLNANQLAYEVGLETYNEAARDWLVQTYTSGSELIGSDDPEDEIVGHADAQVPIYTGNVWEIFYGVAGWSFDSQFIEDRSYTDDKNMTELAQLILYEIAEQLIFLYLRNYRESAEELMD